MLRKSIWLWRVSWTWDGFNRVDAGAVMDESTTWVSQAFLKPDSVLRAQSAHKHTHTKLSKQIPLQSTSHSVHKRNVHSTKQSCRATWVTPALLSSQGSSATNHRQNTARGKHSRCERPQKTAQKHTSSLFATSSLCRLPQTVHLSGGTQDASNTACWR